MTTIANRPTRIGNLVKMEFGLEHGYERSIKTLTVAAYSETAPHGVEIGQVYAADGTILVAADVAGLATDGTTPLSVLVDDTAYTDGHSAGDVDYVVIEGGPGGSGAAILVREQLKFGDTLTSGQIDTVVSVLNSQGIKIGNQY